MLTLWFITGACKELWKGNIHCEGNRTLQIISVKLQLCLGEDGKKSEQMFQDLVFYYKQ